MRKKVENIVQLIRNLKVITKLYLGFSLLLVLLIIVSIYSITVQGQLAASTQVMYEDQLLSNQQILSLSVDFQDLNATVASALLLDAESAAGYIDIIDEKRQHIEAIIEQLSEINNEQGQMNTLQLLLNNYKMDFENVTDLIKQKDESVGKITAKELAVSTYNRQMKHKVDAISDQLTKWTEENSAKAEQSYLVGIEQNQSTMTFMYIMVILAAIITIAVGKVVADSIVKPLKAMLNAATLMAQGKLNQTITVNRKDELGQLSEAFNHVTRQMREIIHKVRDMAGKVQHSMEELSQGSEQTATSATMITESVQQIADHSEKQKLLATTNGSDVEQMSGDIHHVTNISAQVLDVSQHANEQALQGNQAIQIAVEQMNVIQTTMNENVSVVKELNERMKQIGKMADMISDISSQTNLLSLNASIEAARAGEHGRGFAVVADEVKKLSEISGESSKQISQLLAEIEKDTQHAIQVSTKGNEEVLKGADCVNDAGQSFQSIVEQMEQVNAQNEHLNQLAQTMSESTEKMLASIQDIVTLSKESAYSTGNVAAATEEQVASVEQFVALVHSVNKQSKDLLDSLAVFDIGEDHSAV